jgi:hypothetical protein
MIMNFWDERYKDEVYVYGLEPNDFFAEQLKLLKPGTLILPCEGEGRNAVYAASLAWNVNAYDSSVEGKNKALKLANQRNTTINYDVIDATLIEFEPNSADCIAFIYAHFPQNIRAELHKKALTWLKPGGTLMLEAFNPKQLGKSSGGPKDLSMLYDLEMMVDDFKDLEKLVIETKSLNLSEGKFHEGEAEIIRVVGVKSM